MVHLECRRTLGFDYRQNTRADRRRKLEFVDTLMTSLAGKPPLHQPTIRSADYDCLNIKLKTFYQRKRKQFEDTYPDFYDQDLTRLFGAAEGAVGRGFGRNPAVM